jgi:hypothetical protein
MTDMYAEVPEVPVDVRTCPVHGGIDSDDGAMPIKCDLLFNIVFPTVPGSSCDAQTALRSWLSSWTSSRPSCVNQTFEREMSKVCCVLSSQ